MSRLKLTLGLVVMAGATIGGWFAAPYWQANPSVRSAARLLFRQAADDGTGGAGAGPLTLNGFVFSLADLQDAAGLRSALTKLRDAAYSASPSEAEAFAAGLMDQLSRLSPGDLRSLAIDLARDEGLRQLMDETTRAVSLRMLSKDLEQHLLLTMAKIVQRDPDRMLLLAEAMPESATKQEFLSRTLMILSLERPMEVLALLNGEPPPLGDRGRAQATHSALHTLACRSLPDAMAAWSALPAGDLKNHTSVILMGKINEAPEEVLAWISAQPEELRKQLTFAAMEKMDPPNLRRWLDSPEASRNGGVAYLQACGQLMKSDPATALQLMAQGPALEDGTHFAHQISGAVSEVPMEDLLRATRSMDPARRDLLLSGAFLSGKRTVGDLSAALTMAGDADQQRKMGQAFAMGGGGDFAAIAQSSLNLPPGSAREALLATLSQRWSRSRPDEWVEWLRTASPEDQNAAVPQADAKVWAKPETASFLATRPPVEQLPLLANIYREDAAAAAGVIERASSEGASPESLDNAALLLAQSWRDRDPATARAFAQALADPVMADRVFYNLAAGSASPAAREAAAAAVRDPVARQQAERAAALRALGIERGVIPRNL